MYIVQRYQIWFRPEIKCWNKKNSHYTERMMRMVFFQKDAKLPQEGNRKNATYSENHKSKDGEKFLRHIFLFIQFYLLFLWLFCIKWGNINVSWVIEFLICGYKVSLILSKMNGIQGNCSILWIDIMPAQIFVSKIFLFIIKRTIFFINFPR